MAQWHDTFLTATQEVHCLSLELAELKTELTVALGDLDALEPVCSFKRIWVQKLEQSAFCQKFPAESEQCMEQVAPQLRRHVYPTRSYF